MRGIGVAVLASLFVVAGCTAGCDGSTGAPSPNTVTPPVTTTTPPGGRLDALFCQLPGPYYVQILNPTAPGKGLCSLSQADYTQEQFGAIPGLKRRCNFDRDEQIAQKHALVSIYSDGTASSIDATRTICGIAGNPFIE